MMECGSGGGGGQEKGREKGPRSGTLFLFGLGEGRRALLSKRVPRVVSQNETVGAREGRERESRGFYLTGDRIYEEAKET